VPRYDFNWQTCYRLKEPKAVKRGTTIRAYARFDNSKDNPFNPNPDALVRQGPQIWDEMAESWVEWMAPFRRLDAEEPAVPSADKGASSGGR
jgi:hypothetical protein